jgi:hypothetical protein
VRLGGKSRSPCIKEDAGDDSTVLGLCPAWEGEEKLPAALGARRSMLSSLSKMGSLFPIQSSAPSLTSQPRNPTSNSHLLLPMFRADPSLQSLSLVSHSVSGKLESGPTFPLLHLSVPQFPHLQTGDKEWDYLVVWR